jgi:hypothetical protein
MVSKEIITLAESSTFRKARVSWPLLFGLVAVGIIFEKPWLLFPSLVLYAIATVYILAWRCPRCHSLFGVKFGFISIAWPFFNSCIHCGSRLEKPKSGAVNDVRT